MKKIQIVDYLTKEILLEKDQADLSYITELFRTSPNPFRKDCVITGNNNEILSCRYISHSIIENGDDKIYQLYFETKPEKNYV